MSNGVEAVDLPADRAEASYSAVAAPECGGAVVSLVPGSCIQFIDMHLPGDAIMGMSRRFYEEDGGGNGVLLHSVSLEDGVFYHPLTEEAIDASRTFLVTGEGALQPFLERWLPLPYLRQTTQRGEDDPVLDAGPTNWARVYVRRADGEEDSQGGYHIVLAFDTTFDLRNRARGQDAAPTLDDVRAGAQFRFPDEEADIAEFATEGWIDDWLAELHREHVERQNDGLPEEAWREVAQLEYLACYLTLLEVLRQGCHMPVVRFNNTLAEATPRSVVGVDLVLDIGRSRTAALLHHNMREDSAGGRKQIFPLPLRDLSEPWRVHAGIFSSRIEFARADFGKEAHSRWSGRTNAFHWPSLCRIGSEAAAIAAAQQGAEDISGLSATMRYLWDEQPTRTPWRFSAGRKSDGRRGPLVSGPQLALLSEQGDVLGPNERRGSTTKPWFSRSSLMTFFAAEVLLHAVVAINAPQAQGATEDDAPKRRLERIVLTLPPGMHPKERQILRRRIEGAVDLVWQTLGWSDANSPLLQARPEITFALDNATNAQVTYLYNEIADKFRGKSREYFDLVGRLRPQHRSGRSLRIASIDIGGGGSSLAVATYERSERGAITGTVQVKDAFSIGGDDVARALIERILLPAIERRLDECRLHSPRRFLEDMLAGNGKGRAAGSATLGRRFASEVAMPAAIGLLKEHDGARTGGDDAIYERTLRTLIASAGAAVSGAVDDFEEAANDEGAEGFSLLEAPVSFLHRDIADIIAEVLEPVLANAARVVRALDCDLVLLSGWLSRSAVVLNAALETMPARPGRIVQLHSYRVGSWFPYADTCGQLGDPKLPAAIGALLASDGPRDEFSLQISPTETEPPRFYLGRINAKGQIGTDDLMFVVDENVRGAAQAETCTMALELPALIGQRRMPLDGWPVAPAYVLEASREDNRNKLKTPIKVTFERIAGEANGADEIGIVRAIDCDGTPLLGGDLVLRLQSAARGAGHWLDTGMLAVA